MGGVDKKNYTSKLISILLINFLQSLEKKLLLVKKIIN